MEAASVNFYMGNRFWTTRPPLIEQSSVTYTVCTKKEYWSCDCLMLLLLFRNKYSSSFSGCRTCSKSFFWIRVIGCLWLFVCVFACVCFVSNQSLSSAPPDQAPVPGCRHSSCVIISDHTCVLVCLCLCMCIWKCVGKAISMNTARCSDPIWLMLLLLLLKT